MLFRSTEGIAYFSIIPMFWACFDLIMTFKANGANPLISEFIFELFASIAVMYALYCFIGFLFGKSNTQRFVFATLLSIFLVAITLSTSLYTLLVPSFDYFIIDTQALLRILSISCASIFMLANLFNLSINLASKRGLTHE